MGRHLARRPVASRLLDPVEVEPYVTRATPLIVGLLGGPIASLRVLQATEKSQTYAFEARGADLVAKFHANPAALRREKLGLMLVRGGPAPELVGAVEDAGLLVMTRLPGRAFEVGRDPLSTVVSGLARLHRSARRNLAQLDTSGCPLPGEPASGGEAESMRGLLADCARLWGAGHIPVAIADLKPEHVLMEADRCGFVDLETTSVGCSELYDLLSLVDFLPDPESFWRQWRGGLAQRYLAHAGLGADASPALLTQAMERYEAMMLAANVGPSAGM